MIQTEEQIEFLTAEEARVISNHAELLYVLHKVKYAALKGLRKLYININEFSDETKMNLTELGYKFKSVIQEQTNCKIYYISWEENE